MHPGRLLILVWLVVGMTAVTFGHAQDARPGDPESTRGTLYLRETLEFRFSGGKHFTTFPPSANNTTREVELMQSGVSTATAPWIKRVPPADWVLEEGAKVEAVLWLRGLRELIPTYEPREYDEPGHVTVRLSVFSGDKTREPEYYLMLPPPTPLGTASTSWRYDEVPEGDVEVRLTIPIESEYLFKREGPNGRFEFRVDVFGGRGVMGSPVRVLVQSEEHPSRIVVPGFPWDAMRERQEAARDAADCRVRTLEGQACGEAGPPERGEDETQEAPARTLAPVVVTAAFLAGRFRRRADKPYKATDQTAHC